eukprot:1486474-Prymnesium_polylepis.1
MDGSPASLASAWSAETLALVYKSGVSDDGDVMSAVFRLRQWTLFAASNSTAANRLLQRLTSHGLRVSEVGLDFSRIWAAADDR